MRSCFTPPRLCSSPSPSSHLVLDANVRWTDAPTPPAGDDESIERLAVWQEALELGYRDHLLGALTASLEPPTTSASAATTEPTTPAAQAVFCIDVRSEGFRRHLETIGDYETIGFAGFFGLPIRVASLEGQPVASCPVIVDPRATVAEVSDADAPHTARAHDHHNAVDAAWAARADAKAAPLSPFAFAEAAGWALGPLAALRTFAPLAAAQLDSSVRRSVEPEIPTSMQIDAKEDGLRGLTGLADEEQVAIADGALRTMSLTSDFAPLVLLCGHRSTTTNNPFAAALDCGACAGKAGGPNARILAEMLNRPPVRAGLRDAGIDIADSTWFVAGEHDTTTDVVQILDRHRVPATHLGRLSALEHDLAEAGRNCAAERQATLPGAGRAPGTARDAARRASDWAEPVAEWGLVRNAAVVVGPRALTAGRDLGRRVFLHSYDPDRDPDGSVLGSILTGPLLVGHWISSQYYFSTVDPEHHGAGTKPLHNLVGGIGVYEASAAISGQGCRSSRSRSPESGFTSRCGCWPSCRRHAPVSNTSSPPLLPSRSCSTTDGSDSSPVHRARSGGQSFAGTAPGRTGRASRRPTMRAPSRGPEASWTSRTARRPHARWSWRTDDLACRSQAGTDPPRHALVRSHR